MANETAYKPQVQRGNGVTREIAFRWQAHEPKEVFVELIKIDTEETKLLTEGADYKLTLEATGGVVLLNVAPDETFNIKVSRKTSNFQGKTYSTTSGFQATEVENSFDRVSCCLQDMEYNIETFKTDFTEEVNQTIETNKQNTDTQITEFENEVNSKIEQVNEAVQKLNRLDEVLTSCEGYATTAEEQSIIAQQQAVEAGNSAVVAEEALAEIKTEHTAVIKDIQAQEAVTTTNINKLKNDCVADIKATGIHMEDDRLFYQDTKGVVHEFRNDFGGVAPMPVKHRDVKKVSNGFVLTWTDPDDSTYQENLYCEWGNTLIVRKEGAYPESPFDGVVVVDSTIRNQFAEEGYLDEVDTTRDYKYRAFPRSINLVYSLSERNKFGFWKYAFSELNTESDPAKRITYLEDNEYFKQCYMDYTNDRFVYGDWENSPFFGWEYIRPCMVYNEKAVDSEGHNLSGQVMEWLDPNDHSKTIDGKPSHVADSSCNANAMVWKKRIFTKRVSGYVTTVYFSNEKLDKDYECFSCKRPDGSYADHYFTPMYHGTLISNVLRSISGGKTAISGKNAQNEIDYARANGTTHANWDTEVFADIAFEEDVFKLVFKNTNSQAVLGIGVTDNSSGLSGSGKSGRADQKGQNYGSSAGNFPVKFRYRENYYAYQWQRIRGLIVDNGKTKVKMTKSTIDGSTANDYNITGAGYVTLNDVPATSGSSGGYQSGFASTKYATFSTVVSGSSSTYTCDGRWYNNGIVAYPYRGGNSNNGSLCGAFYWSSLDTASHTYWSIGASLSCKPL